MDIALPSSVTAQQVTTDGGQLLNDEAESEPEITRHVEPSAQGGAAYLRCEGCGREVIGTDASRLWHREECPTQRTDRR